MHGIISLPYVMSYDKSKLFEPFLDGWKLFLSCFIPVSYNPLYIQEVTNYIVFLSLQVLLILAYRAEPGEML